MSAAGFASHYVTTTAGSDAEACARIVLAAEVEGWQRFQQPA